MPAAQNPNNHKAWNGVCSSHSCTQVPGKVSAVMHLPSTQGHGGGRGWVYTRSAGSFILFAESEAAMSFSGNDVLNTSVTFTVVVLQGHLCGGVVCV